MKKYIIIALLSLFTISLKAQTNYLPKDMVNASEASQNRFYPRTSFMTFSKMEQAISADASLSEYYQSLDGSWKFLYLKDAAQRDAAYTAREFDDSSWGEISVPSNWEMSGIQGATYADSVYSFSLDRDRMRITSGSSVGIYRREFKVPYLWEERQIFLHIGGARSGSVVWVNGKKVGFSKDSKTPAEYDITKYVEEGYNTLAIETYNTTSGSLLEAADSWQLTGINRSVYLYTQPKVSIRDFSIRTSLNPEMQDGMLELGVITKSYYINPKAVKVYYDLFAPDGQKISYASRSARLRMRSEDSVYFAIPVPMVKKWSAETPYLYTLVMRVQREGRFTEAVATKVGFRDLDFSGERLLVNGVAVKIKGVVYAEHSRIGGHRVSRAEMESDLLEMKSIGINGIRTEHPMPSYFYELSDSIGFYLYDMANISSKPMGRSLSRGGSLGNNIELTNEHIARVIASSQHNRNYPSVVMQGMGTSGGNGYNFYRAYQRVKMVDKLRPIVYEAAGMEWNSDIFCPVNPTLNQILEYSQREIDRPYIFTELAIDSDLISKWQVILASDNLQGGFIASWQTKSLPAADGQWVAGDDSQAAIISKSGKMTPLADQLRGLFTPFVISLEGGELTVDNRSDMIELGDYRLICTLEGESKVTASETVIVECSPHTSTTLSLSELLAKGGSNLNIAITEPVSNIVIFETNITL